MTVKPRLIPLYGSVELDLTCVAFQSPYYMTPKELRKFYAGERLRRALQEFGRTYPEWIKAIDSGGLEKRIGKNTIEKLIMAGAHEEVAGVRHALEERYGELIDQYRTIEYGPYRSKS